MTRQNPNLTLPKCQTATNVSPLEHESSPKNDSSLVLRTEYDCQQAKKELAYLEENFSEVSAHQLDVFYERMGDLCQAIGVYENRGFTIAKGSDISPEDLKAAGFTMRDFKFYPSSLLEIKKRLPSFVVLDLSKGEQCIYSFDRCPF